MRHHDHGRRSRAPWLATAAIVASAWAAGAQAQDAAAAAPDESQTATTTPNETVRSTVDGKETIIVTARRYVPTGSITANKTDIPLIETPQSISVVTRDQIDLLNFIDAQQAVRYTAGVFGENYGPDLRFDFFTVRGFTPKQYIDGLPAPISTTIFSVGVDLYAFESLDLLKGPASVLYGNAPPGGIYNQVSRRPSSRFGGEILAKYGTDDYRQVAGTVTGPISDQLSVRMTGLYRDRDFEVDHVHAKRALIDPSATLRLGDRTSITGLFYYQYDRVRGGEGGFLPSAGTIFANPNGRIKRSTNLDDPADVYTRRQSGIGYEFEHGFSDAIKFTSNTKWSRYHEKTPRGVYNSGGFVNTTDDTLPSYFRDVLQSNFTYKERVTSFATDNRLAATVDSGSLQQKLLVGLDYRRIKNKAAYGFDFGTSTIDAFDPEYTPLANPDFGYPTRYNDQTLRQTGLYGQDQIALDRLRVTLGGRYDWVRNRYAAPFTSVADPTIDTRAKQHKFTYRAGATYVTDAGVAPYLSYATSFEPQLGNDFNTGKAYDPSTGRQWEAGVKYDARGLGPGVKLFATAALFVIRQKNVVSTTPSTLPVGGTQSGAVRVRGGELELVARIRDQLSINGSYSYTDSKILRSNVAAEVGAPLVTTPRHKASLFVDYTIQQGALGGLGFGAGVRYTSRSAGSLPQDPSLFNPTPFPVIYGQAATLADAIVHYDLPGWRFAVNGSNILDKKYVARCSGQVACFYGAGRQIIGTITKKF